MRAAALLRAYADIIVRVGLNLQPGQRLLITEPHELQGVSRHAAALVTALAVAAQGGGVRQVRVIWGDEARLQRAALERRRDELNARRPAVLRFRGPGTDLTVALPPEHVWCTARLTTKAGRPFVANLPTEEIFTVPHKDSAEGVVRIARPVACAGTVIEGIELEFRHGRVVKARARGGEDLLHRLLATDAGAARLGEVAVVPAGTSIARTGRLFHHSLLDENACSHLALGEAYGFTLRTPDDAVFNRSLIHVDLPFDPAVEVEFA